MFKAIKTLYDQVKRPLKIADLCCGYGLNSFIILQEAENVGFEIESITSYDISDELLNLANLKNTSSKITFKKADLENDF